MPLDENSFPLLVTILIRLSSSSVKAYDQQGEVLEPLRSVEAEIATFALFVRTARC